jgi:hypothetical protein
MTACAAGQIASARLKQPKLADRKPERAVAAGVVRDLLAELGTSVVAGRDIAYTPPLAAVDLCTASGQVVVSLGGKAAKVLKVVAEVRTAEEPGGPKVRVDPDKLQLRCLAP